MRLLDRYIQSSTLKVFVLVISALTALFSLLDFVEQLSDVGHGHYQLIDAFGYVVLGIPARALQLTPVAALLASLLALGAMANDGELAAMRTAGVSARRIIISVFKLGIPVLISLFLIAEFVIPPAEQLAQRVRASRLSSSATFHGNNGFWAAGNHRYIHVRRFDYGSVPQDIRIYIFAANGDLRTFIHANRAYVHPNGAWLLTHVVRKRFSKTRVEAEHRTSLFWHSFLRARQINLLRLAPQNMAPSALYRYIRDLKREHQDAGRYEQVFWSMADMPLAMAAMVLTAIPFVFGAPRAQSTGQRMMFGILLGMVFSLSEQIVNHLGLLLDLNPVLSALGPSALLLLFALYILVRLRI